MEVQYSTFIFGYFQVEGTQPGGDGKLKLEFNLKAGASQTPHCPNNYVNHVHCPKNIRLKTEQIGALADATMCVWVLYTYT